MARITSDIFNAINNPYLFFKDEVIPEDRSEYLLLSSFPSGFGVFINSFAFNFACSIRSLHLSNAKSFNFTIFLSISPVICQTSGKLSMCVIHQGIDILSDSQVTGRTVFRRPPFWYVRQNSRLADLFILFPGIITVNDPGTSPCSPWHEQRGSSLLSCIRHLVF